MTIIGKSFMHLSKPFTKRIMSRNYSVFLKNRIRCEKWTEVKRNCLVRSCYTNTPDNQPDKDPKKKSTPQKEKYKEYMETVGDRKGLVKKSTNFGRILPVGLLNDFKNSSKILIIPINCEQDQNFLEKPETVNAIKVIRKHFKEIEIFAEYSKPYITVMRNSEPNMLQAVPVNTEAADSVMSAAITDFSSGKPGTSKVKNKDLEEVLKGISKSNPKVQQIEINEFVVDAEHEEILAKLTKSSSQLSNKIQQAEAVKIHNKLVAALKDASNKASDSHPTNNQRAKVNAMIKSEAFASNSIDPIKILDKSVSNVVGPETIIAENSSETPKAHITFKSSVNKQKETETSVEEKSTLIQNTIATTAEDNILNTVQSATTSEQSTTALEQTPLAVDTTSVEPVSETVEQTSTTEASTTVEQTSATEVSTTEENSQVDDQVTSKNVEVEEAAVSAQSSSQETEGGYINPYPESISELDAESKPSITSITFDFETDVVAKEEMAKEEVISEDIKSVAMNMSTMGVAAPEKEKHLIPVNFNAVITGSVKMSPEKLPNAQVTNMEPEQLNKLIGDILTNLGEGGFHPKDATIRYPKHQFPTTFMVAPQVREEYPYSDGRQLMDAAVYKRAIEETKKIKNDLGNGPLLVEMKSANDSCKVCTSKGTTCNSKKSSPTSTCGDKPPPSKEGPKKLASAGNCGGEEKPKPPVCKKPDENKKKGCDGSAPKGSSQCGAKLKPSRPCPAKPKHECNTDKKEEDECQSSAKKCKSQGSCGQSKSPPASCGQPAPGSLCSNKKSDESKDGDCGKKDCGKKTESPCGSAKPKTNPSCGQKKSPSSSSSCSGCDKKDKWDMSYTKLLCPVNTEYEQYRIFSPTMLPFLESIRWFRGSIVRHWNREENMILNKKIYIKSRKIMDIQEEQIDINKINEEDVVVKIDTVALTGSDLYLFESGNTLLSLGHGSSGIITKVGSHVASLDVGDRVAIEPAVPCGSCSKCLGGLYNVCPDIVFKGALSKYCVHPALFCHKLPKTVSLEDASLLNTLATGYQACVKAKISAKSNLIVIGSCPLALATVMCARAMGAAKIVVASAIHTNTKLAEEIGGADGVIVLSDLKSEDEILQEIHSNMPLVDVVIDCSGCSQSINVATKALKAQGRCVLAGCQSERAQLNIFEAQLKEVMLIPSLWSCNKFPAAIKLLESNRAPLSELITHRFGFMESQIAFEKSIQRGDHDVIQAVIKCQSDFT